MNDTLAHIPDRRTFEQLAAVKEWSEHGKSRCSLRNKRQIFRVCHAMELDTIEFWLEATCKAMQ